jgi:hypothetical protein
MAELVLMWNDVFFQGNFEIFTQILVIWLNILLFKYYNLFKTISFTFLNLCNKNIGIYLNLLNGDRK